MPNRRSFLVHSSAFLVSGIFIPPNLTFSQTQEHIYFAPASRIGFKIPATLHINPNSERSLLSADHTLRVDISEPTFFGNQNDKFTWKQGFNFDLRLEWERTFDNGEVRRLFVDKSRFVDEFGNADPDYDVKVLVVRKDDWFGMLSITTGDPLDTGNNQKDRWSSTIDDIVESTIVRPTLTIEDFFEEHQFSLDTNNLNARHFGDRLIMSLEKPKNKSENWTMDHYIAMESPPRAINYLDKGTAQERKLLYQKHIDAHKSISEKDWIRGPVHWFYTGQRSIPFSENSPNLVTHGLRGISHEKTIEFTAYSNGGDNRTTKALLAIADSFSFTTD